MTDCGFDFGAGVVVAVVMAMVSDAESYAMEAVMVILDYGHDGHSDDHRARLPVRLGSLIFIHKLLINLKNTKNYRCTRRLLLFGLRTGEGDRELEVLRFRVFTGLFRFCFLLTFRTGWGEAASGDLI